MARNKIEFDIEGIKRLSGRLDRMETAVAAAAVPALVAEGEKVMTEAKRNTPVDTGTLRSSGRVRAPEVSRNSLTVPLTFGGAAQEYAVYVHEDLQAAHTSGQAKFLEDPVKRHAARFATNVRSTIAAVLRRT